MIKLEIGQIYKTYQLGIMGFSFNNYDSLKTGLQIQKNATSRRKILVKEENNGDLKLIEIIENDNNKPKQRRKQKCVKKF